MTVTVVYGPQGCGKTINAQAFRRAFGATVVVDPWDGISALPEDCLALTNRSPPFAKGRSIPYAQSCVIVGVEEEARVP